MLTQGNIFAQDSVCMLVIGEIKARLKGIERGYVYICRLIRISKSSLAVYEEYSSILNNKNIFVGA